MKATMKESPKRYINPFLSVEENEKVNLRNNVEDEKSTPSESLEMVKECYVTECQLPELIACYEDNGFHVVKDICVDDGLTHGEKIECEKEHDKLSCNTITVNGDKDDNTIKDDFGTQLISPSLENSYNITKDDNFPSKGASDEFKLVIESNIVDSRGNLEPDNSMQNGERKLDSNSNSPNISYNNDVDQTLSKSAGTEAAISNETKMEENPPSNFDNVKPATNNDPQSVNQLPLETKSAPNNNDMASVSGLITYLGPISSTGSISHRSDGSNTSVGSFAFPILQNEWNSSPVRMSKVDSSQSRKNGGWRQAFMCCGF